jgi:hypothetical protein
MGGTMGLETDLVVVWWMDVVGCDERKKSFRKQRVCKMKIC